MKIFLKRNILAILSFLILILWCLYAILTWKLPVYNNDPILLFYNILADDLFLIGLIAPIFVIIPSIQKFHTELHNGYIKNCLLRTPYKKYITSHYKKSILKSMILPLFIISFIMICCIKLNSFSFGSGADKYNYFVSPDQKYAYVIYSFMLFYLIGMILNSIFYTNLGLIFCKKNSNFFVSVTLAFLTIIGIDIIAEILVGGILFGKILGIHQMQDTLNLFNIWYYSNVKSLIICLIYYCLLVATSSLLVYLTYKNKENVLYESEK